MKTVSFYDALNRRIGVDDNGTQTWTVYDGTNPYADFNGSGTLEERYQYGPGVVNSAVVDQLLARTNSSGTTAWYLPDKLGSVRDIVSPSGTELDHIVYDSFGNVLSESAPSQGDRFKFAGMEYDPAAGLYYDRARYYNPVIGTFISQDPLGFGGGYPDLFSYVGNGPTDETDPTGCSGSSSSGQNPVLIPGVNASFSRSVVGSSWMDSFSQGDLLDNSANFFGGYAHTFSNGLTTRILGSLSYGGVSLNAGLNPGSGWYKLGQGVGFTHSLALSFATPCMAQSMSTGFRALQGVQASGGLLSAGENASQGNIGSALLDLLGAFGNIGSLSQTCFAAGTPILTPGGSRAIDELRPGDYVLSRPERDRDGAVEQRVIEHVFELYSPVLDLRVGGQLIKTTAEHPMFVEGRGWTPAAALRPGDRLSSVDGGSTAVESVERTAVATTVYNIRIAEYHTYFVGCEAWGFSIWVHNPSNSYMLGANMVVSGVSRAANMAAHHIIAATSKSEFAEKARDILTGLFGSHSINFAFNGVFLPRSLSVANPKGMIVHSTIHTNSYYKWVYDIIDNAAKSSDPYTAVVEALEAIAAQLSRPKSFSKARPWS